MKEQAILLLKNFLPKHQIEYCESETHCLLGEEFKSSGIVFKLEDETEIFGASSSADGSDPILLAAYECLERYCIQNYKNKESTKECYFVASNGVAIHSDINKSKENALLELIERSEILKSWYNNTPTKQLPNSVLNPKFKEIYDVYINDFSLLKGIHVIGIFCFPKKNDYNLVYGFGAAKELSTAIGKAKKEMLTRLSFLHGEIRDPDNTYPINSGLYHQEYYLNDNNHDLLKKWLTDSKNFSYPQNKNEIRTKFEDITPLEWTGQFCVTKAIPLDNNIIPLFFGIPPKSFDFKFRCDIPHPIV